MYASIIRIGPRRRSQPQNYLIILAVRPRTELTCTSFRWTDARTTAVVGKYRSIVVCAHSTGDWPRNSSEKVLSKLLAPQREKVNQHDQHSSSSSSTDNNNNNRNDVLRQRHIDRSHVTAVTGWPTKHKQQRAVLSERTYMRSQLVLSLGRLPEEASEAPRHYDTPPRHEWTELLLLLLLCDAYPPPIPPIIRWLYY